METERKPDLGEEIGFEVELGAGFPIDKDGYRRRGEGGSRMGPILWSQNQNQNQNRILHVHGNDLGYT
jgi:hypothetical protein